MLRNTDTYDVVWPRAARQMEIAPAARRHDTLEGKTVAQLWDYLFRGDEVFDHLERGLKERYPSAKRQRVMQQVEEELETIREVGYEAYFLMVWDLLQACRREGISWITRGSAADSLVCYCLRISDVCPKRFERRAIKGCGRLEFAPRSEVGCLAAWHIDGKPPSHGDSPHPSRPPPNGLVARPNPPPV